GQSTAQKTYPADLISFQVLTEDPFHPSNQVGKKIQARRGEVVRLRITGTPKKGYHTYPVTKRTSVQEASGLTRLKYGEIKGLVPLWPIQESEPDKVNEEGLGVYLEHERPF